jgi:hypothetical protein
VGASVYKHSPAAVNGYRIKLYGHNGTQVMCEKIPPFMETNFLSDKIITVGAHYIRRLIS